MDLQGLLVGDGGGVGSTGFDVGDTVGKLIAISSSMRRSNMG